MNERQQYDPVAKFTRPWAERRGIRTVQRNGSLSLLRVPLDQLSDVLATHALETRRDVLGAEVEISGYFELAYQVVGQNWSVMVPDDVTEPYRFGGVLTPTAADLSKQLKQPVIELYMSDTGGEIGYQLFEDGEIIEYFRGSADGLIDELNRYGLPARRYILSPYQSAYFWSRRRRMTAKEMGDVWKFADRFIRESDAFDPGIGSRDLLGASAYSLKRGRRFKVQTPEFILVHDGQEVKSVPDLVRVDYFRFGN